MHINFYAAQAPTDAQVDNLRTLFGDSTTVEFCERDWGTESARSLWEHFVASQATQLVVETSADTMLLLAVMRHYRCCRPLIPISDTYGFGYLCDAHSNSSPIRDPEVKDGELVMWCPWRRATDREEQCLERHFGKCVVEYPFPQRSEDNASAILRAMDRLKASRVVMYWNSDHPLRGFQLVDALWHEGRFPLVRTPDDNVEEPIREIRVPSFSYNTTDPEYARSSWHRLNGTLPDKSFVFPSA
ncbi:MAG: hypothetical protein U0136_13430 [Bdellovibrionota bacterium]